MKNSLKDILESKKYSGIDKTLVEEIYSINKLKYKKEKEVVNKTKTQLHQIWGAFSDKGIDFDELKKDIKDTVSLDKDIISIFNALLVVHKSSLERLSFVNEFYYRIFEKVGEYKNILDIGCAFNPFSIPFMNLKSNTSYTGIDIDNDEIKFLNWVFKFLEKDITKFDLDINVTFEVDNAFSLKVLDKFKDDKEIKKEKKDNKLVKYDVIFLFKLLPLLELIKKGSSRELLQRLINYNPKAKLVVSFPLKSLSGKDVGMSKHYKTEYTKLFSELGLDYEEIDFDNEVVYVLKKG